MLIDRYLPQFDVTEVHEVIVDAPAAQAYAAIRKADLRDPIISALFAIRQLPDRIASRLRGDPLRTPSKSFTFQDIAGAEVGWVLLGEDPGSEFVVGSVGRVWKRDYGRKSVPAEAFTAFEEPGYAKIVLSFSVLPVGFDHSLLRYEARTGTTDEAARARFHRYWMLIRPGVTLVMRRALARIKAEAEQPRSEPARA